MLVTAESTCHGQTRQLILTAFYNDRLDGIAVHFAANLNKWHNKEKVGKIISVRKNLSGTAPSVKSQAGHSQTLLRTSYEHSLCSMGLMITDNIPFLLALMQ
jgi:hypothetical protein